MLSREGDDLRQQWEQVGAPSEVCFLTSWALSARKRAIAVPKRNMHTTIDVLDRLVMEEPRRFRLVSARNLAEGSTSILIFLISL
jgi:hypothetical protein